MEQSHFSRYVRGQTSSSAAFVGIQGRVPTTMIGTSDGTKPFLAGRGSKRSDKPDGYFLKKQKGDGTKPFWRTET